MDRAAKLELISVMEERTRRAARRKLYTYYPDTGPLRRELYPKHLAFFEAGATFMERLFLAANRVGKTEGAGGYEVALHLTGDYPAWWNGKRFTRPVDGWCAGDTSETVRDVIQFKLLGPLHNIGTGLIPADAIYNRTLKRGIGDAVDTVFVKHKSGGISQLSFKSYDQGRQSFQGTKKDFIWADEEPPLDVYTEMVLRLTATTGKAEDNGLGILTFTPLMGMSETVLSFLPGGEIREQSKDSKFVVGATWDDVPHLDEATKKILWSTIPPFQRDARSKGIPQLGSGAIFPVQESDFVIGDFDVPDHWPRAYGMDVGWNRTAAAFGALDRDKDILYLTGEHYRGQAEPIIHVSSINAQTKWRWPGVIDPASRGRAQSDGRQLLQQYIDLGLDLDLADNSVESGLHDMWQRLSTGRLKVFKSCQNWLFEFRLYRRDEKGRIVKTNDHLMDATRYLVKSGIMRAKTKPVERTADPYEKYNQGSSGGWMS